MNNTARTVAAALATLGLSTTAHAATYVVTSKSSTAFDAQLARQASKTHRLPIERLRTAKAHRG